MARFYLDENVAEILAVLLIAVGHDAVSTRSLGRKGTRDPDQLLFAATEERIFVTYDSDHFVMLHAAWVGWSAAWATPRDVARHVGTVVVQQNKAGITNEELAEMIHSVVSQEGTLDNRLLDWTRTYGWRELV
jgi:predicted nuclease of predicted toxin-antitoxin system